MSFKYVTALMTTAMTAVVGGCIFLMWTDPNVTPMTATTLSCVLLAPTIFLVALTIHVWRWE